MVECALNRFPKKDAKVLVSELNLRCTVAVDLVLKGVPYARPYVDFIQLSSEKFHGCFLTSCDWSFGLRSFNIVSPSIYSTTILLGDMLGVRSRA